MIQDHSIHSEIHQLQSVPFYFRASLYSWSARTRRPRRERRPRRGRKKIDISPATPRCVIARLPRNLDDSTRNRLSVDRLHRLQRNAISDPSYLGSPIQILIIEKEHTLNSKNLLGPYFERCELELSVEL